MMEENIRFIITLVGLVILLISGSTYLLRKTILSHVVTAILVFSTLSSVSTYMVILFGAKVLWYTIPIVLLPVVGLSLFFLRNFIRPLGHLTGMITDKLSKGNLVFSFDEALIMQNSELGRIARSLDDLKSNLVVSISEIKEVSLNISSNSEQQNLVADQIAEGASEQAASAEEISSSMEEMTATSQQNAENAGKSNNISLDIKEKMNQVNIKSSQSFDSFNTIVEKIQVINDIAFQTNILALNAAVEAARAGDEGKGFGVVATEVKKLAEISRGAADEISELSQANLTESKESREMINSILPHIEKSSKLVESVSNASKEQTNSTDQINYAIQQLSTVTQHNAGASEELSASAEQLVFQSEQLVRIVDRFRV